MSINSINGLTVEIPAGLLASTTSRAVRRPATAYLGETGKEPPKQFVKFVQFVAKTLPKLYCSRTCRTACSRKSALPKLPDLSTSSSGGSLSEMQEGSPG